jgi:hypothetical protein
MSDHYKSRLVPLGKPFASRAVWFTNGTFKKYDEKDYCTLPLTKVRDWWGSLVDQYLVLVPVGAGKPAMFLEVLGDMPGAFGTEKPCTHFKPISGNTATYNNQAIATEGGEIGYWNGYRPGYNYSKFLVDQDSVWQLNLATGWKKPYQAIANGIKVVNWDGKSDYCDCDVWSFQFTASEGDWETGFADGLAHNSPRRVSRWCGYYVTPGGASPPLEQLTKFGEEDVFTNGWPKTEAESYPEVGWAYSLRREADHSFASKTPCKNHLHEAFSQAVSNISKANSNSFQNVAAVFHALKTVYDVAMAGFDIADYKRMKKAAEVASKAEYAVKIRDEVDKAKDYAKNVADAAYKSRKMDKRAKTVTDVAADKAAKAVKRAASQATSRSSRDTARSVWDKASELWLTNRYVIQTSKADVEEGIAYAREAYKNADETVSHGSIVADGARFTCTVKMQPHWDDFGSMGALEQMWELGFANPRYTAWDMVPFSFMVDWFVPIGSYLEAMDDSVFLNPLYLGLESVTYSIKYETDLTTCRYEIYTRWPGRAFDDVIAVTETNDGTMQQTGKSTSYRNHYRKTQEDKRTAKRVTDCVTIFL